MENLQCLGVSCTRACLCSGQALWLPKRADTAGRPYFHSLFWNRSEQLWTTTGRGLWRRPKRVKRALLVNSAIPTISSSGSKATTGYSHEHNNDITIRLWEDVPVETIHFKNSAKYAKLNSCDEAVVNELTKSIIRGDVKITGAHACVNNIGNAPVLGCKEIEADVPVPTRHQGDPIYAHISSERVTRGSSGWYIHTETSRNRRALVMVGKKWRAQGFTCVVACEESYAAWCSRVTWKYGIRIKSYML